ncbi:MAG: ParB N-terminal domain-containing protein [Parachlamydiaceae bacterium]
MQITYIPISKLKPNEKNPRKIVKEQFEKLCKNIQDDPEFFAMRPCLVNETEDGLIVYAGNQRLQAAKKLKLKEVPCIVTNDVPEYLIKRRVVLDNLHHGEHDFDMLAALYDPEELIDLGMLDKELGLDIENIDEQSNSEKKKKLKMCPQCGHEF